MLITSLEHEMSNNTKMCRKNPILGDILNDKYSLRQNRTKKAKKYPKIQHKSGGQKFSSHTIFTKLCTWVVKTLPHISREKKSQIRTPPPR